MRAVKLSAVSRVHERRVHPHNGVQHGYGYEEDMRAIAEIMISEAGACHSEVGYRIGGDLIVVRGNEAAVMKVYSPVVNDGGTIGIGELR